MAARAGRAQKAAGWAISLGLHLLFLAVVLLAPVRRLVSPPAIEVRLAPPDFYSPLQPTTTPKAAPPARAPAAQSAPPPPQPALRPTQPVAAPATPPVMSTAAVAPSPLPPSPASPAAAPAPARAAGPPASAANGAGQAAVNALRQTFGCSSGMRQILTPREQAGCEQRAAERTKDLPDRSGDTIPKYKRDYYDAVVAAQNGPNHIPGTTCTTNVEVAADRMGNTKVMVDVLHPVTCIPLPGAGPKPPEPTLKDLGLAR